MEETVITLYTGIGNPDRVFNSMISNFEQGSKSHQVDGGQLTITLQDDTLMKINRIDYIANQEETKRQMNGMAAYYSQVKTERLDLQQSVIQQILCFTCIVGIRFELTHDANRTHFLINAIYAVASEINAYLLYPSMEIFNSEGRLVFSLEGKSELEQLIPTANSDLLDRDKGEESEADRNRMNRSIAILEARNIPYISHLRVALVEEDAVIRDLTSIAKRVSALFAVALYSEVRLSPEGSRREALSYFERVDEVYHVRDWLTPKERAYIEKAECNELECIQFVWRYECCEVLLWALGLIDELTYPDSTCHVPRISELLIQYHSLDDLIQHCEPRSQKELLDAADLIMRYDWACVDARINQRNAPAELDAGVVLERHYALNWLVGGNGQAEWDDSIPHT